MARPYLFQLKDVPNKELLKVFIGIVNAQLLEAVLVKILKTKDVQYANGAANVLATLLWFVDGDVDLIYHPKKHAAVNSLHKGIAYVHG